MKRSTQDRAEGKLREVAGGVKVKAGQLSNTPDLEAEGEAQRRAGKVQQVIAKVEKTLEK